MQLMLDKIEAEITLDSFDYARYFPNSKQLKKLEARNALEQASLTAEASASALPLFSVFVATWRTERSVEWRASYIESIDTILDKHLIPEFGDKQVNQIDRAALLAFRAELARAGDDEDEKQLSPATVNRIMGIMRQIMDEVAMRHEHSNPCLNIKRLKQQRIEIEPFSMDAVQLMIEKVRADYKNYLTVRFFTGMRSGEVHGLKWKHVDFERRQILIRETFTHGRTEYTKTDGSQREIDMSLPVYDALLAHQAQVKDRSEYVFSTRDSTPLDNKNFDARVWKPLLRHLGLTVRRPYQMRHTCATLWLAAGENPEWIAKQLGHTTTEMLFRVYSRYVPNLTRKDGSAFDRLVTAAMLPKPIATEAV